MPKAIQLLKVGLGISDSDVSAGKYPSHFPSTTVPSWIYFYSLWGFFLGFFLVSKIGPKLTPVANPPLVA